MPAANGTVLSTEVTGTLRIGGRLFMACDKSGLKMVRVAAPTYKRIHEGTDDKAL